MERSHAPHMRLTCASAVHLAFLSAQASLSDVHDRGKWCIVVYRAAATETQN